jgi:2-dehydro-3-deoxyphosphooctonate aldolase (KDO 8-P synthase)
MDKPAISEVRAGDVVFGGRELAIIAGPCVIENAESSMRHAGKIAAIADESGLKIVFKSSFDKANRTSIKGFRGPGLDEGMRILGRVKDATGLPILTDIHEASQAGSVAEIADILQIPALLSRQTDLLVAAGKTSRVVNIKKGQFLAPWDMKAALGKVEASGNRKIIVTERGFSFGYNNLVSDMRSIVIMRGFGYPVVFDATHSVQLPGAGGERSGGQREFIAPLARAAVAAGADAIFMEVHEDPDHALSDGANSLPLEELPELLTELQRIRAALNH